MAAAAAAAGPSPAEAIKNDVQALVDNARGSQLQSKIPLTLTRGHAALLLWNLAVLNDENRAKIASSGGIAVLRDLLVQGNEEAKHHAAGCLAYMALLDENRPEVAKSVQALSLMLTSGRDRAAGMAAQALVNLAESSSCTGLVISAVPMVVRALAVELPKQQPGSPPTDPPLVLPCMRLLYLLSAEEKHRKALCAVAELPPLMLRTISGELGSGTKEMRSFACVTLGNLLSAAEEEHRAEVLELGAIPPLVAALQAGTCSDEGRAAAGGALLHWTGAPDTLARICSEGAVAHFIDMLTPPKEEEGAAPAGKKAKGGKKKKAAALPPAVDAAQCTAATALARISADFSNHVLLSRSAEDWPAPLVALLEGPNEATRACARQTLWNINHFGLSETFVESFSIDGDIVGTKRSQKLHEVAQTRPYRTPRSALPDKPHQPPQLVVPQLIFDGAGTLNEMGLMAPISVSRDTPRLEMGSTYGNGGGGGSTTARSVRAVGEGAVIMGTTAGLT
mmetsp:Transcript_100/g.287  ORF Transcript_100/g.287 Transcript_100/m.287 type:complete len:508 (+) Transcript_100:2-1525(+)